MGDPCEPVLMMLRNAGEALPPLAGQLAAKGYGIVDVVGTALDPVPAAIDGGRVVDLALVSAGLSVSPDLPDIAARLRVAWPRLPLVCLPEAASVPGLPALSRDMSLSEICERLDELVLAAAGMREEARRLRWMATGLAAQVREARLALGDAVADARRLLAEARALSGEVDSGSSQTMRRNQQPGERRDRDAIVKLSRRLPGRSGPDDGRS